MTYDYLETKSNILFVVLMEGYMFECRSVVLLTAGDTSNSVFVFLWRCYFYVAENLPQGIDFITSRRMLVLNYPPYLYGSQ